MGFDHLAEHFAEWAYKSKFVDIPEKVVSTARLAMLDTLGVIIAGSAHPEIIRLFKAWHVPSGNCLIPGNVKTDGTTAALLNGVASHVWDFDDASYTGIMHGSAVIFPTVMALAQELNVNKNDCVHAFIVGSEIAYVLADVCHHQHYFHGWWSTGTFGLIGATAAAALLLKSDKEEMMAAISMAACSAGIGKASFGTLAKPFFVGECASRAIRYAKAVKIGFGGPANAFEDHRGYYHLFNNDISYPQEAESLGKKWRLVDPGLLVKRYPVCSAAHAAIEVVSKLTYEQGKKPDEISKIRMEIPELVKISLVYDRPTITSEAQFSLPFAVSCAVLKGKVELQDLDPKTINSAEILELMNKVEITVSQELSSDDMRQKFPESARVTVVYNDGDEASEFCGESHGMPSRPLTFKEFSEKFNDCLMFAGLNDYSLNDLNIPIDKYMAELFAKEIN